MEVPRTSSGKPCKLCIAKGGPCHLHGGSPKKVPSSSTKSGSFSSALGKFGSPKKKSAPKKKYPRQWDNLMYIDEMPKPALEVLLLNMTPAQLHAICSKNKRAQSICKLPNFQSKYQEEHPVFITGKIKHYETARGVAKESVEEIFHVSDGKGSHSDIAIIGHKHITERGEPFVGKITALRYTRRTNYPDSVSVSLVVDFVKRTLVLEDVSGLSFDKPFKTRVKLFLKHIKMPGRENDFELVDGRYVLKNSVYESHAKYIYQAIMGAVLSSKKLYPELLEQLQAAAKPTFRVKAKTPKSPKAKSASPATKRREMQRKWDEEHGGRWWSDISHYPF